MNTLNKSIAYMQDFYDKLENENFYKIIEQISEQNPELFAKLISPTSDQDIQYAVTYLNYLSKIVDIEEMCENSEIKFNEIDSSLIKVIKALTKIKENSDQELESYFTTNISENELGKIIVDAVVLLKSENPHEILNQNGITKAENKSIKDIIDYIEEQKSKNSSFDIEAYHQNIINAMQQRIEELTQIVNQNNSDKAK